MAVLGGHGLATVAYAGLVKDQVAAGNMRVIGVMADKRIEQLPDVKTLKEQGIDVPTGWTQWRGVVGPKNMPDDVKNKLAQAIEKVMSSDEMKSLRPQRFARRRRYGPGRIHQIRDGAGQDHRAIG